MGNGLFASAPYEVLAEDNHLNYVYLTCRDKASGRPLKLTALADSVLNNSEAQQEFSQLVRLQKRISHPSVAGVLAHHETGEIGDREYVATEIFSKTLESVVIEGLLEPKKVESLILKIATGLSAIHAAGVLHLDLKPAHILVDEQCTAIKIDNFESACEIGVQITSIAMDPKYSAPEKYLADNQINEQADIYSLGVMAFELAVGPEVFQKVFEDIFDTSDSALQNQRWLHWHMNSSTSAPRLSSLTQGFTERFSDAIAKMMAKSQETRYLDLSSAINDLGGLNDDRVQPLVQPLDLNAQPNKKKGWHWLAYALLFLLVAAGGGYYGYDVYEKKQLEAALQSELSRVIKARNAAEALGANDGLDRWVEAESAFGLGKGRYDEGRLALAIEALRLAYQGYIEVIDFLQDTEIVAARDAYMRMLQQASDARVSESYPGFQSAVKYGETAEAAAGSMDTEAAVEAFEYGAAELEIAIRQAPRLFFKGSTAEDIDNAFELCQKVESACDKEWYNDELGEVIEVGPFYIDKTEVSVGAYKSFVESTGHKTTAETAGFSYQIIGESSSRSLGANWNNVTGLDTPHYGSMRSPVLHVSFTDALAYCDWKGMRLPSEAEWEYAASGASARLFAWGSEWRDDLSTGFIDNSGNRLLAAVDSYGTTPEGLAGITGGVWEWTSTKAERDTVISKGGAWSDVNPAHLRIRVRRAENPTYSSNDLGFRCAQSAKTWEGLYGSGL